MATIKRKKVASKKVSVKKLSPAVVKKSSNNMPMVILAIVGLVVIVWNAVPAMFGKPGDIDLIKEVPGNYNMPRTTILGEWLFSDPNDVGPGKAWNALGGAVMKRSDAGVVTLTNISPTSRLVNRGLDYNISPSKGQNKQLVVKVEAAVFEESKLRTTSKFAPVERDIEMKVQLLGPKSNPNEQVENDGEGVSKIAEKTIKIKANKPMAMNDFVFDAPINRKITMIRFYPVVNPLTQPDSTKFMGKSVTRVEVDSIRVIEKSLGGRSDQGESPEKGKITVEGVVTKMGENGYSINNKNGKLLYALQGNFSRSRDIETFNKTAPNGSEYPYVPVEKYVGKTVMLTGVEQKGVVPGLTVMSLTAL